MTWNGPDEKHQRHAAPIRETEMAALRRALARCGSTGRSAVAEVAGAPGMGKSTLLAAFGRYAADAGWRVLPWRFGPSGSTASPQPGGRAAHAGSESPLVAGSGRAGSESPLAAGSGRAGGESPLAAVLRPMAGAGHAGGESALAAMLRPAAGAAPRADRRRVLIVDDAHLADPASAELLAGLLRQPPLGPVLLVLAHRPRQLTGDLAAALATGAAAGMIRRVALRPLSPAESAVLLPASVPAQRRSELHAAAEGNPLYLLGSAGAPGPVPKRVRAALEPELLAGSPADRLVVWAAAIAGDQADPELIAAVAECEPAVVYRTLDLLAANDLLRPAPSGPGFRFRHEVVRAAAYESAPAGWRLAAHARAAAALGDRGAAAADRADHLERCATSGDEDAAETLGWAASGAAHRAPADAARWLTAALRLLPAGPQTAERRNRLQLKCARALGLTGRLEESRARLHRLLVELPAADAARRTEAVLLAARTEQLLGRHAEADALLRGELRAGPGAPATRPDPSAPTDELLATDPGALEESVPGELVAGGPGASGEPVAGGLGGHRGAAPAGGGHYAAASGELVAGGPGAPDDSPGVGVIAPGVELAGALAAGAMLRGDAAAARRWSAEVLDRSVGGAPRVAASALSVLADRMTGFAVTTEGPADANPHEAGARGDEAGARLDEAADLVDAMLDDRLVASLDAVRWLAEAELAAERIGDALRHCDRMLAVARETDRFDVLAVLHGIAGRARLLGGDLPGAVESLERAAEAARRSGSPARLAEATSCLAWSSMWQGDAAAAARLAARAHEQDGAVASRLVGGDAAMRAWRGLGEDATAAHRLCRALESPGSDPLVRVRWLELAASTCADRGFPTAASACAASARQLAARAPGQRIRGYAALAEAHALLGADPAGAAGAARLAADLLARAGDPLGDRGARRRLDAAMSAAGDGAGAAGAARAAGPAGLAALTVRETEVVTLVAEGLTNKEIAHRLFLSPGTVSIHVGRAYAKLGVSRRAAAAARLVGAGLAGPRSTAEPAGPAARS